jgi:segregation and condensation protein A
MLDSATPQTQPQEECPGDSPVAPGYFVHLDNFEGPLDLLLHLIQQERMEIWEISIARITRQYLEYLQQMEALNVEIAGEFLVMAATLMRLKSKRLLPRPLDLDDEGAEGPLTEEALIARLLTYRTFKEAAAHLRQLCEGSGPRFPRGAGQGLPDDYEYPLAEIDLYALADAWQTVMQRHAEQERAVHAVRLEDVRLEDQVTFLLDRLQAARGKLVFGELFTENARRLEIAVTLLAALELARQQVLELLQEEPFADIWMLSRVFAEASAPEPRAVREGLSETSPQPAEG